MSQSTVVRLIVVVVKVRVNRNTLPALRYANAHWRRDGNSVPADYTNLLPRLGTCEYPPGRSLSMLVSLTSRVPDLLESHN